MPKWQYTRGLHDLGNGLWDYLLPDGSWGWSNAGLIVDGDQTLLVDTPFDLKSVRDAAFDIPLGRYADWSDAERIVVTVWNLFQEFSGKHADPDIFTLFEMMADFRDRERGHAHAHAHAHRHAWTAAAVF